MPTDAELAALSAHLTDNNSNASNNTNTPAVPTAAPAAAPTAAAQASATHAALVRAQRDLAEATARAAALEADLGSARRALADAAAEARALTHKNEHQAAQLVEARRAAAAAAAAARAHEATVTERDRLAETARRQQAELDRLIADASEQVCCVVLLKTRKNLTYSI